MFRLLALVTHSAVLGVASASGGEFTFSYHEAEGSGSANVFDGGPTVFDSDATTGSDDRAMEFIAFDLTQISNLGASALAFGRSEVFPSETSMEIRLGLDVRYSPSAFPGGDLPGGETEGRFTSTIEFVAPADEIQWSYWLEIDETAGFTGFTRIVIENVTKSETLATLTAEGGQGTPSILSGIEGDLFRITSAFSASGSGPVGIPSFHGYTSSFRVGLRIVPEPGTVTLLAIGSWLSLGRRRGRQRSVL